MRSVSIRDVAAAAGVAVGTVSRVLNDAPGVAPSTRERVQASISVLGYRPNRHARALSSGKTHVIGAVVPFFTHPSAVERLRGAVSVLEGSPYDLVLYNVGTTVQRLQHLAHRGAIGHWAMTAEGQFDHPLVIRAKLEIAAACHAHAKTPSHSVVTEFKDTRALESAAERACTLLGYTRMWSIHPDQIRPIVEAFAPRAAEVDQAIAIITAAQAAGWAPISHRHGKEVRLHDRASYRYYWQVIERAHRTSFNGGPQLPAELCLGWFGSPA